MWIRIIFANYFRGLNKRLEVVWAKIDKVRLLKTFSRCEINPQYLPGKITKTLSPLAGNRSEGTEAFLSVQ